MRVIRIFFIVLGVVCVACGAYGFYVVAHTRVGQLGLGFDEAVAMMHTAHLTFTERVTLFALEYRLSLLVGGLADLMGILIGSKTK